MPELGAVLVEPIPSADLRVEPREFLQELRQITARAGVPLIFDELISGFRLHPRGAAGYFGVRPDLSVYGKVVGGGLPIGIVAGSGSCMDFVDGGGKPKYRGHGPAQDRVICTSTFARHPLAMVAARTVLERLIQTGPSLQKGLNARANELVVALRRSLEERGTEIQIRHTGSWFRFAYDRRNALIELFFQSLLSQGVYVGDGRMCFISTAHSRQVVRRIVASVDTALEAVRRVRV